MQPYLVFVDMKHFFVQHQLFFVDNRLLFVQHQTFCFDTKLFFVQHQNFVLDIWFSLFTIFFKLIFCTCCTKKMLCCTKHDVLSKKKKKKKKLNKNVLNRSYVAPKNMLWQKKILCGSKKRDSCWLNMFSGTQKKEYMLTKKVHAIYKYMLHWLVALTRGEALISMWIPKYAALIWGPALIRENTVSG